MEKEKFVIATDKLLVDDYEFDISNKGKIDTALNVFWSLYTEESVGLFTTVLGANAPEISYKNARSVVIKDIPASIPHSEGKVTKIADFGGPSFRFIVRGYLPNGIRLSRPIFLAVNRAAMDLDTDTLGYAKSLCIKLYNRASQRTAKSCLYIAETEFTLTFDEYGALYFTDEILTPNKTVYWSYAEKNAKTLPKAFHSQPALRFVQECKLGRRRYNRVTVSEVEEIVASRYASLYRYLIGSDWHV